MRERWDVVLRFLNGPMAREGDVLLHGPVVRLGANPGPEGLRLTGYRGLDDRQAVITVYETGHATVAPVGTSQVRLAPHEHQRWGNVLPLREAAYLTDGCAFHLGPPNRGVTVRFVACKRLGEWQGDRALLSEAGGDARDPMLGGQVHGTQIEELRTDRGVPWWFIPGFVFTAALTVVGLFLIQDDTREVELLGIKEPGLEAYDYVDVGQIDLDLASIANAKLLEGFEQAFGHFVMTPNVATSGRKNLNNPDNWDQRLFNASTLAAQNLVGAGNFWKRLEAIKDDYAYVVRELRGADLPDVFAAIPYQESRYDAEIQSPVCAKGYWQLMPEVAHRMNLDVSGCEFSGTGITDWAPTELAPPTGVLKNADYMRDKQCIIPRKDGCAIDERTSLERSTEAAIGLLSEAWLDAQIRDSGAAVQIVIISHNAGYDDEPYVGKRKRFNVLPAYQMWLDEQKMPDGDPHFVGEQIRCEDHAYDNLDPCGSKLQRETQHYAYNALAQHFLAACYYGYNYANDYPVFKEWQPFTRDDGYCTKIDVPSPEDLQ